MVINPSKSLVLAENAKEIPDLKIDYTGRLQAKLEEGQKLRKSIRTFNRYAGRTAGGLMAGTAIAEAFINKFLSHKKGHPLKSHWHNNKKILAGLYLASLAGIAGSGAHLMNTTKTSGWNKATKEQIDIYDDVLSKMRNSLNNSGAHYNLKRITLPLLSHPKAVATLANNPKMVGAATGIGIGALIGGTSYLQGRAGYNRMLSADELATLRAGGSIDRNGSLTKQLKAVVAPGLKGMPGRAAKFIGRNKVLAALGLLGAGTGAFGAYSVSKHE